MKVKPKVFFIMPFEEDFFSLFEELKNEFSKDYEFINAGDLENQQNILQNIVEGINMADVVIADLTGLNPNVFYELGLAHAMNKKVIIITQNISELPFDIKSYKANEYSLLFHKIPILKKKLKELLDGAIDGSIKYGNPVSDYLLPVELNTENASNIKPLLPQIEKMVFSDYEKEIKEYLGKINNEVAIICEEMSETCNLIEESTFEIIDIRKQRGNDNSSLIKNIFRKLAFPIETLAIQLQEHTLSISEYWNSLENCYLSLLEIEDLPTQQMKKLMKDLEISQTQIDDANEKLDKLTTEFKLKNIEERKLSKALAKYIEMWEFYLSSTDTISSSIDRILNKSKFIINTYKKNKKY